MEDLDFTDINIALCTLRASVEELTNDLHLVKVAIDSLKDKIEEQDG